MGDTDKASMPGSSGTKAERLTTTRTRDELYDEANRLKIEGRAEMTAEELAAAICKAR